MEVRQIQYRALTEPISQAPEVEHLDAFWRQPSEPVRKEPRSHAALVSASLFLVLGVAQVEEVITQDKWFQPASEPVRLRERPVDVGISILVLEPNQQPEDITQDKWWRPASEPTRLRERALDEGGYFNDNIGRDEEPHPDAFVFKWEFPRRRARAVFAESAYPPYQEEAPVEDITLDKWQRPPSEPVRIRRRTSREGFFAFDYIGRDEEIFADKWWRPADEPVRLRRRTPETGEQGAPLDAIVSDETVTLDKWFWLPANPVLRRLKAGEWVTIAPDRNGEDITQDKWWMPASEPVRLRDRALDTGLIAYEPELADARSYEIAWWRPASEPKRRIERVTDVGLVAYLTEPTIYVLPNLEWYRPASEPVRFRALFRVGPMEWRSYDFLVAGFPGRIVFRDEAALIRFAESAASIQTLDTIGHFSVFWDEVAGS